MKKLIKIFKKPEVLLVCLIVAGAIVVRFYNFPNRVTFWSEQARSLIVSADYLKKPSLLGQEYFERHDHFGHVLYSGALFNYLLAPLLLVSKNPVFITIFFSLLDIVTGAVLYLVARKVFGPAVGLLSALVFLFNDYMIYHSLFIWIYNFLPLVGILTVYLIHLFMTRRGKPTAFLLGIVNGFGIGLQILYAPIALGVLIYIFWKKKMRILVTVYYIAGVAIVNLPMILFDLRHDFYNTRTYLTYLMDTIAGKSNAGFSYYYLLPFWPVAAIALGVVLTKIIRWNKFMGIIVIGVYLFLNLTSGKLNFSMPSGMPLGVKVSDIDSASRLIAGDAKGNFNVTEVLDFDKRAYVLRYFTEYIYGAKPLGVEEYKTPGTLYVLSLKNYDFTKSDVWEIKAGAPYKISYLTDVAEGYSIYRLTR